jgi:hypothetical protein
LGKQTCNEESKDCLKEGPETGLTGLEGLTGLKKIKYVVAFCNAGIVLRGVFQ